MTGAALRARAGVHARRLGPAALLRGGQTVRGRGRSAARNDRRRARALGDAPRWRRPAFAEPPEALVRRPWLPHREPAHRATLGARPLLGGHDFACARSSIGSHRRLAAIPGVTAVAFTTTIPFSGGASSSPYLLPGEGDAERKAHKHEVQQRTISSNYFSMIGIPVIAGRAFSDADRSGAPLDGDHQRSRGTARFPERERRRPACALSGAVANDRRCRARREGVPTLGSRHPIDLHADVAARRSARHSRPHTERRGECDVGGKRRGSRVRSVVRAGHRRS